MKLEFEIVKAEKKAIWEDILAKIEPGMAARFEKDEGLLVKARAYIWRYPTRYTDFFTYTDEEFFYLARREEVDA